MKPRWVVLGLLVTAIIVPAAALSAARLLDLPGGAWVRLVSFTPYATLLYLLAVLVLVPAAVRGRGVWKGTAWVLVAVMLLGAGMHAFWARGPYVGGPSTEAAGRERLHVMTANLRFGRADTAQVVEDARSGDVDVLVLQEVTPEALTGLREAGVGETFRHHAGQAGTGPAGTMVFSRTRLSGVERLRTQFGSYAMDVAVRGGPVHLLAVHPRPPIGDVGGWRSDHGAVRHAARAADGPTVVVGDLNATTDHVPMRVLHAIGYTDGAVEAGAGWQPTWPVARRLPLLDVPVPTLVAIDHVLVRDGLRVTGIESLRVAGSDHRALVAVVTR